MTSPRVLGERYELGELLGRGGMAEVHLGRDVRLGRDVAIKVLRADLARDPSFQVRFRREAQAAAALNHPAIVSVYDTGEDPHGETGPTPYIVMELVEGRTLRDILRAEGRLHPQRAMEITADVCAALDFSHRGGIVHRDVKPGNVMITRTGAVKVMDFGIARAMTDSAATVTATAQVIGTAQYLSPEQARGENVDARSDVYSAGCMLYELVTGNPPFTGDSPVAVAYQHVRENANPPSSINPDVPAVLDAIVLKAMAKNPANRYQSAAEMRADLGRAMSGRTVMAEPVMSAEERTTVLGGTGTQMMAEDDQEMSGRRKAGYIALALAVLLVLAGGGYGIYRAMDKKKADTAVQVQVPDLNNLTKASAKARLNKLKLDAVFKTAVSNADQKNRVVKQAPDANTMVDTGSKVTVTIGQGPDTVDIPQLAGLPRGTAMTLLKQNGFTVSAVHPIDPDNPQQAKNTVVRSDPTQGSAAAKGSAVILYVSNGRVQVPNLFGLTVDDAKTKLSDAGFTSDPQTKEKTSTEGPAGSVIAQSLQHYSFAEPNATIVLTIAKAAATTPPPTTTAPPTTAPTTTPPTTTPPPSSVPSDTNSPSVPVGPGDAE
ncbi:MAG TPA: Stk1 family PASTA domain-containing Ser/Thr kinase [Mycobacteriales bacterium]|jgi:serine/threonine-protein kinase|nr:Stk1 family PASTA domain-containing Ser/Thr kinase [Mycobacteriales bacterium]